MKTLNGNLYTNFDQYLNTINVIKMGSILEEINSKVNNINEKNGEQIITNITNKIDKNTSFNDLFKLSQMIESKENIKEDADIEYSLRTILQFVSKNLPSNILNSKFTKMTISEISFYANQNEKQRQEVKNWLRQIYKWGIKNKEVIYWAKLISKSYDEKISRGMTDEEIYDWYFTNKNSINLFSLISFILVSSIFLFKLWSILG